MTDSASPAETRLFDDAEALAQAAAAWICDLTAAGSGDFAICLSGGSTPRRLYELLAAPPAATRLPWPRVHWFWGDERFVPPHSHESNFRMVREALLARVPAPPAKIHPIPTEGVTPDAAASAYQATLVAFYGQDTLDPARPLFDLTLLGIGADGHTASLFPGHAELSERRRWAVPAMGADGLQRISLTYPALNSSRNVAFLAVGKEKRASVARAQAGDTDLPAARIRPAAGRLVWFLDRAASPEQ
ncbi:MAG TPA: 6-phosphogluconolactonase [Hyphomicrobiaceae bacterium]|nr:6-phosphogluconolactonase [Hyphomicrobiaceae bacterium]